MEIRANKRWLQKRRRELLAAKVSQDQIDEMKAVEYAIEAMRSARGAIAFRKQLKRGIVLIPGSVAGGTGSGLILKPGIRLDAVPRKKPREKRGVAAKRPARKTGTRKPTPRKSR